MLARARPMPVHRAAVKPVRANRCGQTSAGKPGVGDALTCAVPGQKRSQTMQQPVSASVVAHRPLVAGPPGGPLAGLVRVPGDKSISHRALMLAALAEGPTRITGLLEGEDVLRTAAAMRALGAEVARQDDGSWRVVGRGIGRLDEPGDVLDMGNSGTAARLLAGILASHPINAVMTGDASLRRRPMGRVIEPLSLGGARFIARAGGRLPLCIEGAGQARPIAWRQRVASAQVKSAILLAGLNAEGETVVEEPVKTRDHSENMLRHFGAVVGVAPDGAAGCVIRLQGRPLLLGRDVAVPSDPSSAAFPLVAALLVPGSSVTLEGVGLNPLRTGLFATLREMGADMRVVRQRVEGGEPVGDLVVQASRLRGVEVPASRAPSMIDEYPVLAVAAAFARGETRMRGLAELRVKESDRLAATLALLQAGGVAARIEGDDLVVVGDGRPVPGGGRVLTQMDHRLAMSAVVLGVAAASPVTVDDVGIVETSFPGFVGLMNRLGAGLPE